MTDAELLAQAKSEALKTTVTPDEFLQTIRYTKSYDFRQAHWYKALTALEGLKHPTPKPPPAPSVTPNPRLHNVAVGAFSPWDALQWPRCGIWISADPALDRFVVRATADQARNSGHDIGCWYVPDQVTHDRALEVADRLGTDLIAADCETLLRWKLAYQSGVRIGIYNLTALWQDAEAWKAISSGEFHGINEFYWNQDKTRRPDNHNLPVDSMCIAVYDGHSDSSSLYAWEPHIPDYQAAGYLWPTVSVYQQNMTAADWARMPVKA